MRQFPAVKHSVQNFDRIITVTSAGWIAFLEEFMGITRITHISVYVRDQDETLAWYIDKLGFKLCEDNDELFPNF